MARPISISTHAPLAGRDSSHLSSTLSDHLFQPTRPLRGATQEPLQCRQSLQNFNPRAPCGARRSSQRDAPLHQYFNPRAPCGARLMQICVLLIRLLFQPTRPLRGATTETVHKSGFTSISTHAPLAGRDLLLRFLRRHASCISTHAPLAGRDRGAP